MNGHKVNNVTDLYNDAKRLYEVCVAGGEGFSADSLINSLSRGIENLKANWKGVDAGVQINAVIRIYNATVEVRNVLAQLAVDSSKVAVNYRAIQAANSNAVDELTPLSFTAVSSMAEYTDTADTVDINIDAINGKNAIDNVVNYLDDFKSQVQTVYDEIMGNWQTGSGRDEAIAAFTQFSSNVNSYQSVLTDVSNNVSQALRNYGLLQ